MHSISLHSISKSCLLIANGLLSYTLFCLLILRYSRVAFSTYIETRKGSILSKLKLSKLGYTVEVVSVLNAYALICFRICTFRMSKCLWETYLHYVWVCNFHVHVCLCVSGKHWMSSCKCITLYSHFMLYEIINSNIKHYIRIGLGWNDYRVLYYSILLKKILVWNLLWMEWKSVLLYCVFLELFFWTPYS